MGQNSARSFSIGWVLASYLILAGSVLLVSVLFGLLKIHAAWASYVAFGLGAVVGGFFAGRASPHYSVIESTLAGLLVVGSIVLLFVATPLASLLAMGAAGGALVHVLIIGVIAGLGAFAGGYLGELSSKTAQPERTSTRWIGIGVLVNLGCLWTSLIVFAALLLRDAGAGGTLTLDAAASSLLGALALAAFAGGLFTQIIAPARIIIGCAGGTLLAFFGLILMSAAGSGSIDRLLLPAAVAGALAGVLSLLGASVGWVVVRSRVLAEQRASAAA
jgi:hypothetical protein